MVSREVSFSSATQLLKHTKRILSDQDEIATKKGAGDHCLSSEISHDGANLSDSVLGLIDNDKTTLLTCLGPLVSAIDGTHVTDKDLPSTCSQIVANNRRLESLFDVVSEVNKEPNVYEIVGGIESNKDR
ncbi:hypothetical protein ACHAW6_001766 [Cyclotella cf. meneghiniana]